VSESLSSNFEVWISDSLSEIASLFDLSLYLGRTLAQRKAERKAKSKVKVTHCVRPSG